VTGEKRKLIQITLILLEKDILPVAKTTKVQSILIIDDEIEVCFLLESFLTKKNPNVRFTTTLKDGIEKCRESKPDILILDHNITDGYGIESIAEFRKLNDAVCIVVISAMSNLKNEALEKGADHFLEKPISFSALDKIIYS
jgi:DNA-binding response OmpR family regulator